MPGPLLSRQWRPANKARASASPSKPSTSSSSSSSRLDAGGRASFGAGSKATSKTTSPASSSLSGKSTPKAHAANALKAQALLGRFRLKTHNSKPSSSSKPRLNLNSSPAAAQRKEIEENTEKARPAAAVQSKRSEKAKAKANETIMATSTDARQSSSSAASAASDPATARQNANATASSSSSSRPAPPASASMPAQAGVGGAPMYYASSSNPHHFVYNQAYPPVPQPYVPPSRRASAPNGYYSTTNAIPSPVDAPPTTFTYTTNPNPSAASTAGPLGGLTLQQELAVLFNSQDQLNRNVAMVLQAQEGQGRMLKGVEGQCATLLSSREGQQTGIETLLKEVREEREEQRRWRESQSKLLGQFANVLTSTRQAVEGVDKRLGKPKGERDERSLFDRLETVEWGIAEIGLILGDPEANMPEGSAPTRPQHLQSASSQQDAGPSTATPTQLNTRDEPIEIDLEEASSTSSVAPSTIPIQIQSVTPPQEPEPQLPQAPSFGSDAPSTSTGPDLHALLGVGSQVPLPSSQSSGVLTPDGTCDFDLEYPPEGTQLGFGSQTRRSRTPEPSPLRVALDHGVPEEDEEETQMAGEDRSKTPEPDAMRVALAAERTPTQSSILPSSSTSTSTTTLTASSSTGTTLPTSSQTLPAPPAETKSTSTCSLDKSTQHFSRVDWASTDARPTISSPSPYKPDAETLSKTPIEKRVSSTLPPPHEGSVAELRLGIVGCAPYVGRGLTLDQNDQLVVEGPAGGHTSASQEGLHMPIPVVVRPSVSPLPSPETTPSQSRQATPVGEGRSASVRTEVVLDEEDGDEQEEVEEEGDRMQVDADEGAAGEEDAAPMQVEGKERGVDPTLDILARNLREVQNLEEERRKIEAELAKEKERKEEEERREQEERRRVQEEAERQERERAEREEREKVEEEERERAKREERERVERETKARKQMEEEAQKQAEEANAREEARRKAEEEAAAQAEKERLENEMKAKQLEMEREEERKRVEELEREAARVQAEAKEKAEKERQKREADLAEARERERKQGEEAKRKERDERERERERVQREKEALARKEEMERLRAQADKEAFEREEREVREAAEREAKARFLAEVTEQRRKREEDQAKEEQEKANLLDKEDDDSAQRQEGEPVQDDDEGNPAYDLDLDLEPESGIDPIYTQLGGPTPAPSHQSIEPSLSPEILPAPTSSLPRLQLGRALTAMSSFEALSTVESMLSTSQGEIEIPDEIDDRVDTSDEGEQDDLANDLEVDQLISSPIIAASSFVVESGPKDRDDDAPDTPASISSAGQGVENAVQPTQNRTITYTPKSFKGGKSQPLLEIVNSSPERPLHGAEGMMEERRMSSERVSETPVPEEDDGLRSELEVVDILPPPTSSTSTSPVRQRSEASSVGATNVDIASAIEVLPDEGMDQDVPESPQEQLFLPGDDDSRAQTPQPFGNLVASGERSFAARDDSDGEEDPLLSSYTPGNSLSHPTRSRFASEEVPEAASTPRPKAVSKRVPPAPETITKANSTSTSSSMQGQPVTPSRSRAHSGRSTPIRLSTGSGIGGRLDSHPASKTLVPTPTRKGPLSRRFEEESRSRERSNSVAGSIIATRKNAPPLLPTPKVKPTTIVSTSTNTKAKKAPVVPTEVIDITSSPETSPRKTAQSMIDKRNQKLASRKQEARVKTEDGTKVKKESEGGKSKGRPSNTSIVIDLTSDKSDDEGDELPSQAKGKGRQNPKEAAHAKDDSDYDSDPPIDGDSDDSAEILSTAPVRRSLVQSSRAASSSQQPARSITDRLNQKLNRPGTSAAATRLKRPIKRRKDGESDDDRPLKRLRDEKAKGFEPTFKTVKTRPIITSESGKVSDKGKRKERDDDGDSVVVKRERVSKALGGNARGTSTTSTVASSSKNRESRSLRQKTVDLEAGPIKWPAANKHGNRKFQRDFIECDMCNGWYHYGCVGIKEDDPRIRLQDPQSFMCPKCETGLAFPRLTRREKESCGRPNCMQKAPKSDEFYVERLVGRKYSKADGACAWLVKWDGYPLSQSTWQTKKDMAEPAKLIAAFEEVAEEEGKDLSNPNNTVLLNEVVKSKWIDRGM